MTQQANNLPSNLSSDVPAHLVTVRSAYGVSETLNRLESMLEEKGMVIFTRVDHAAGAVKAGMTLRPAELLIFGNPQVGTPLMQCDPTMGIELPQKMLAWEDDAGVTRLAYHNPEYMASLYQLDECAAVLERVAAALNNFATAATTKKE